MDQNLRTLSPSWLATTLLTAEEVRVDELVDGGLILRFDLLELQAHAVAAIAPCHAAFGVDVALRAGQAEPQAHLARRSRAGSWCGWRCLRG